MYFIHLLLMILYHHMEMMILNLTKTKILNNLILLIFFNLYNFLYNNIFIYNLLIIISCLKL